MFCEKCGKELKQGERFCPHCGAQCESDTVTINKEEGEVLDWKEKFLDKFIKMSKKKKIVAIVILLVLISGILGSIFDNGGTTVSPQSGSVSSDTVESGYISVTIDDVNRYPDQYMGQDVRVEGTALSLSSVIITSELNSAASLYLEYDDISGPNPLTGDHLVVYGKVIKDSLGELAIQVQQMEITVQ